MNRAGVVALQLAPIVVIGGGALAVALMVARGNQGRHDETYGPARVATCTFDPPQPTQGLSGSFQLVENGAYGRRYAGPEDGPQPQLHVSGRSEDGIEDAYTAEIAEGRETDNQHAFRLWPDGRFEYRLRIGYDGETLAAGSGRCTDYIPAPAPA
ncbi:hypothetical protein [Pseudoroseicyclus sp. CXY001]|uniref:hypothetical protein n=1 Tax=Pseudoroseicyclus sp. CXY001 TaxID=3242492 RepID=UPI00358DAA16